MLSMIPSTLLGFLLSSPLVVIAAPYTSYSSSPSQSNLPKVDLKYEVHQANLYNASGDFYRFDNIRYAQSPTGNLRFAPPKPPTKVTDVQQGTTDRICPQAQPAWEATAGAFLAAYLTGQPYTPAPAAPGSTALPSQDPRTTEDCLFLDVVVPRTIWERAGKSAKSPLAPVMVWIHGGGYTSGSKNSQGNPAGLIKRSENGVIYVSLNYRLGAFGFISGDSFRSQGGTSNAGLLDQAFALKWVQDNIRKFGGDPKRVTVFGESAGGSSILHHITAPANKRPQFVQAILQSPAFQPIVQPKQEDTAYGTFLQLAGVQNLAAARTASYDALQKANIIAVGGATYGAFTFGPAVDPDYVPDLPGRRLAEGRFDKRLHVLVGHNSNEGLLFTSPDENSTDTIKTALQIAVPTLAEHTDVLDYIVNVLYPEPSQQTAATLGYADQTMRAAAIIADLVVNCNTFYLNKAFNNQTYAYQFNVPPALHGQDLYWTYYTGADEPQSSTDALAFGGVTAPKTAKALQSYLTSFAIQGGPNRFASSDIPRFEKYTKQARVQVLSPGSITTGTDPAANERCNYWQQAAYFPKPA